MKIIFASDHAGFGLKGKLISFVKNLGYEVEDKGAFAQNGDDDYPDFIIPVAEAVSKDPEGTRGIILGGSGQGEAMLANRFKNVRAAVFYGNSNEIIRLSREHNNSNILSLGANFLTDEEAKSAVKLWLETPFSGDERHVRRLKRLEKLGYRV